VIAILITIMVLDLKAPHGTGVEALRALAAPLMSYVLSFVFLGIYWNNHHHMLQAAEKVNGRILWANLHLLFWLSLVPWVTQWMGENGFPPLPVAAYGVVLLMAGGAYFILAKTLTAHHGRDSKISRAIGKDVKGVISLFAYAAAIGLAFVDVRLSGALYVAVAALWLAPDPRIEHTLAGERRDA
jgi:uncharacterized membrane protein